MGCLFVFLIVLGWTVYKASAVYIDPNADDTLGIPVLVVSIIGTILCLIFIFAFRSTIKEDGKSGFWNLVSLVPITFIVYFGIASYHAFQLPHVPSSNDLYEAKMEAKCREDFDGICADYYYGLYDFGGPKSSQGSGSPGIHNVNPYTRSDGTNVRGHFRSNPDGIRSNNLNK